MTWDDPLPPHLLADETLDALRHKLLAADYTEAALSALLGVEAPSIRSELSRAALVESSRGVDSGLAVLARLFFLGDEVPESAVNGVLTPALAAALRAAGILAPARQAAAHLRAPVGITPCRNTFILCDPLALDGAAEYGPGGPAMGPGADSETLLRTTPRQPVGRVLDLCTGPGTHALIASAHAQSVLGVDIAPRALAFARANARLNAVSNVRFERADLTRERPAFLEGAFDLVLANPPFVPHPDPQFRYRDGGGPLGDEVLNAILGQLPRLVAPGGHARIISDVAFRPGETLESKLRATVGDLDGWDVVGCEDAPFDLADYARFHSLALRDGRMVQEPSAAAALLAYYRDVGIERVCPVLLALHHVGGGGRRLFRRVNGVLALRSSHLDRTFALWAAQRHAAGEPLALAAVPQPAPDASARQWRPDGASADVFAVEFAGESPWLPFRINAEMFAVLSHCDGRASGAEVNDAFARERGKSPDVTRAFVAKVLYSLAELGVLQLPQE